jgi:hypothetical protein
MRDQLVNSTATGEHDGQIWVYPLEVILIKGAFKAENQMHC